MDLWLGGRGPENPVLVVLNGCSSAPRLRARQQGGPSCLLSVGCPQEGKESMS